MSDLPQRIGDTITTYSKTVILLLLVLTVAIGAGMPMVDQDSGTDQFESDSPAANAQTYIQENFEGAGNENQTTIQVIQRGDNVLSKESIVDSLRLQQEILTQESIRTTLNEERPFFGIENVVGQQAAATVYGTEEQVSIDRQVQAINELPEEDYEALISTLLGENARPEVLGLMPSGGDAAYQQGSTTAEARITIVTQQTMGGSVESPSGFRAEITDAQLDIRGLAQDQDASYSVFGFGILSQEINQSLGDSGAIVGPLALLFVVLALTVAYRDLLDIILGVVGIIAVLVWTFGFMGWADIAFNQLLLSVPVLLIGLSIDYAIHVFMRHREQRGEEGEDRDLRRSMALALGGVGVALVWVTATAAIGFLANLTSPIGPLRDFGIVSAFGVLAALLIFGMLIPALKIEVDGFLEARGLDRQKRAFGTGDSVFSRALASGAAGARRFPVVIVVLALLLTAGGAYGATQVDTSFQQEDFLADSPPEWMQDLPEPFAPGTYEAKSDLGFIQENFQQEGNQGEILIRGDVADDQTLQWLDGALADVAERETVFVLASGDADVRSPLSVMRQTAADPANADSDLAAAFADGVPGENIEALYGETLERNPAASQLIYSPASGEYEALRIVVGVKGDAAVSDVSTDLQAIAETIESESDGQLDVVATGDPVVFNNVEQDLLDTVLQGLLITLVAVFLFLAATYRLTGSRASLGVVTLLPVLFSVTWILGSMWLLEIPFNALTGTITSLTVGLGIAYSIHISSRYELELRRQGNVWDALETTVTGTGGALLGSAATTVGGFGVLVFAILPVLKQFGIITGLTIIYAFLASVLILPSLLVLWTRYLGPKGYFPDSEAEPAETAATETESDPQPADTEDTA
jgi:predicted RND superfamily exporter protein